MNRTKYLVAPPLSERQQLLNQAGTGELELADIYNKAMGTRYPSPLSIEHLRWAVGLKNEEGRTWLKK